MEKLKNRSYILSSIIISINSLIFSAAIIEQTELPHELAYQDDESDPIYFESEKYKLNSNLIKAIEDDDFEQADNLIKQGANVNNLNQYVTYTALQIAILQGNKKIIDLLLKNNANVNITTDNNYSPLILAVNRNDTNLARSLLSHGAKVNLENNVGNNALFQAVRKGYIEMIKLLLAAGADFTSDKMARNLNIILAPGYIEDETNKSNKLITQIISAEPARRKQIIDQWNAQVTKQIKSATGLIPELNKIISEYVTTEKYEDLPIEYKLSSIE